MEEEVVVMHLFTGLVATFLQYRMPIEPYSWSCRNMETWGMSLAGLRWRFWACP